MQVGGKMGFGATGKDDRFGQLKQCAVFEVFDRKTYFREESAKQSADVV